MCDCHTSVGERMSIEPFHDWSLKPRSQLKPLKSTGQQMKDFTKGTLWGRVEPKYCDLMLTGKKSQQKLRFNKIM